MVRHIMKDGRVLHDITGRMVGRKDAEAIYTLLNKINERKNDGRLRRHQKGE